ncbi:hypothetical protein [Micromonospora sp. NPDC005205]|uniref:hypothetical protein n=1 Tax=Micromonospora sp. NPDC005205 TaxID=3156714 RepID=UPI0033B3D052
MKLRTLGAAATLTLGLAVLAPAPALASAHTPTATVSMSVNSAAAQAAGPDVDCPRIHTTGQYAYTWCRVYGGQVRLRADCNGAPDKYSGWAAPKAGNPTQRLQAGPCIFGVGGASSIEWRP